MPKRIISLILLIAYFIACPVVFVINDYISFIQATIWLAPSILMVTELCAIVGYYSYKKYKVVISFKALKTYMDLEPEKYDMRSIDHCIYYESAWNHTIHTAIYMDTIWSQFLYAHYRFKTKCDKRDSIKRKDMARYLDAVQKDIDKLKEKVDET